MTKSKYQMANQIQSPNNKRIFDLAERTTSFSKNVILFAKGITEDAVTKPIISQLVRAATSIGANYMEADCAESRKDFIHKIGICKKEAKETSYWFKIMETVAIDKKQECDILGKEAHELTLIFSAISKRK